MSRFNPAALAVLLSVALGSTACVSHGLVHYGPPPCVLKESRTSDGHRVRYELQPGYGDAPSIVQTDTQTLDRAYLGVQAGNLDAEQAAAVGVTPWLGAYVELVVPGSAADQAGLRRGDILRSLGSTDINAGEQVAEVVQAELQPGVSTEMRVQRWSGSDDHRQLLTQTLQVVPSARSVEQTRTQVHELPVAPGVLRHTGLQLSDVEPGLSREVFDEPNPVVLVTGVVSGSPAYAAGLRGGDRVLRVDGEPVASREDVARAVAQRVAARGWPLRQDELAGHGAWLDAPAPEGHLALSVDGPLGPHTCSVELSEDVEDTDHFTFPILFSYDSDVARTEWSFLDFILQFGATYESHDLPASTRRPERSVDFSMLPFGMFEYRSVPEASESTFFWFIKVRS